MTMNKQVKNKKKYIRPVTELIRVSNSNLFMATIVDSKRRFQADIDDPFMSTQIKGITEVNEQQETFVRGHSSDGGGNRSGYNPWGSWDE